MQTFLFMAFSDNKNLHMQEIAFVCCLSFCSFLGNFIQKLYYIILKQTLSFYR